MTALTSPGSYVVAAAQPSVIVICGKGRVATAGLSFAVDSAAAQRFEGRIAAAATRDDEGFDTWQPSLIRAAMELAIPVDLSTLHSERDLLLISLEYDQIIPVPGTTSELPATPLHATAYSSSFAVASGGNVEVMWAC